MILRGSPRSFFFAWFCYFSSVRKHFFFFWHNLDLIPGSKWATILSTRTPQWRDLSLRACRHVVAAASAEGRPRFFLCCCITACGREHQIAPFMEGHTILLLEMMAEAFMLYKSTGRTKRHTPLQMLAPNQTSSTCDWVPAPRFMAAASSENKHGFWICSHTRFELFSTFNAQLWE